MSIRFFRLLCLGLGLAWLPPGHSATLTEFIADMSARHGFDAAALQRLFQQTEVKKSIIKIMDRSNTGKPKPWHEYRPNFVNPQRVAEGVEFWDSHARSLARAEQVYGVPAQYIVAIVGVETIYGRNTGNVRVLDALSTLAFHYPRRADFFRDELEEFLLLARETGIAPLSVKGSYAGAMGLGQFMPSSWRKYGVDFDGDGRRNLWSDEEDVIGSVANYFRQYGWESGQPVALPTQVRGGAADALLALGLEPVHSLGKLKRQGLLFQGEMPDATPGSVIMLDTELGPAYWLALKNFYVITRYNRSQRYAMAVNHLAEEIARERYARQLQ